MWVVAFAGLLWTVAAVVMLAGGVRGARHRAQMAADTAALAVVTREVWGFGDGCRFARRVVESARASLTACVLTPNDPASGVTAEVCVAVPFHGPPWLGDLRIQARARAGQSHEQERP
ncbi:hypothetical protein GCM10010468_35020 [Actinocorallia longicatena]|uniref:Putative Flp pilus-assembly TadG-like N-terminal domain-containing protein n=1 Tax=Actinocorallia longicatena TaxID=111803 RepID=A0ABP6QAH4_9ACTN